MIATNGWIALIEDHEDDEWWPFDEQGQPTADVQEVEDRDMKDRYLRGMIQRAKAYYDAQ